MVQIMPILYPDQIRNLRRQKHAGVGARRHARRNGFARRNQTVQRHGSGQLIDVAGHPRRFKLTSETPHTVQRFRLPNRRRRRAQQQSPLPVIRVVALRARHHSAIAEHARMAGVTAHGTQFHGAGFPNHPACKRYGAVFRHRHSGAPEKPWVTQIFRSKEDRIK